MGFKSDIEIAQETPMLHIREIAKTAGVDEKYLEQYPDLHRPQNSGHSLCRKAQSPHGAWRSRRCTAYRPPAQVVPNRRRRIRPD